MTPQTGQLTLFDPDSALNREQPPAPRATRAPQGATEADRADGRSARHGGITRDLFAGSSLLTTQEAASLLRVHPRTVQRLVDRGDLGVVRLGRAARFDPSDLANLTDRLKRYARSTPRTFGDVSPRDRATRVSFADRLRSQEREHRAAQA